MIKTILTIIIYFHIFIRILSQELDTISTVECQDDIVLSLQFVNPVNNSYVPLSFYPRIYLNIKNNSLTSTITELLNNGTYHFCFYSDYGYKLCNLNLLRENYIKTLDFLRDPSDENLFITFDFKHKQSTITDDTEIISQKLLCTARFALKCCVDDSYFSRVEQEKLQYKYEIYKYEYIQSLTNDYLLSGMVKRTDCSGDISNTYVIGIKSWALNFDLRQAIRDTWRRNLVKNKYCVMFIVGTVSDDYIENGDLNKLLEIENAFYGDLLLEELNVYDSYKNLVNKTLAFLKWTQDSHNIKISPDYIIVCDDDVYINASVVAAYLETAPRKRFYGGEVRKYVKEVPQRDPNHLNYLSYEAYGLDHLIPYALGNFYILSSDVVTFIVKNTPEWLRPVGSLEDVSIAMWLLAAQIHPTWIETVTSDIYNLTTGFMACSNFKSGFSFLNIYQNEQSLF